MFLSTLKLGGLWRHSMVRSADNSGIIKGMIIGSGQERYGTSTLGTRVRVTVRDKTPECNINKPTKGVIVRTRKEHARGDGSFIKFSDNAFVAIAKNKVKGNKIKGPVGLECQHSLRQMARYVF